MRKKWLIAAGIVVLAMALAAIAYGANQIKLIVNGQEVQPDVPPQLISGRTMVPVRWVAEALGADVQWDDQQSLVKIDLGRLPPEIQWDWQYSKPGGGEHSLGYLGHDTGFLLPVVATLNNFLAQKELESLQSGSANGKQKVLVHYEILDSGRDDGPSVFSDEVGYRIAGRLYYCDIQLEGYPLNVVRAYEKETVTTAVTTWDSRSVVHSVYGVGYDHKDLKIARSWYEDVIFDLRPKGEVAEVQKDQAGDRTTWVRGRQGWYVNESATYVAKKVELKEMPDLYDQPLSPEGYYWATFKKSGT